MTKEQIQQAYNMALDYTMAYPEATIQEIIQIGIQMALQGEVHFDNDSRIIMID